MMRPLLLSLAGCVALTACRKSEATPPPETSKPTVTTPAYEELDRLDFNRRATAQALPLFWRDDANGNGKLDPAELVTIWGSLSAGGDRARYVTGEGSFTPEFEEVYRLLLNAPPAAELPPEEKARRAKVLEELAQGRPTLVETDLSKDSPAERKVVDHVLRAAALVERIHLKQKGTLGLEAEIPADDPASRALFFRNQGPFCVGPKTENDPDCSALPSRPKPVSGLYPAALQQEENFCQRLEKEPNASALMDHFSVVVEGEKPGTFKAVPYTVAYKEDMEAVARELEAAADALGEAEPAFQKYLRAAAGSFRTNDWEPANEAWAAMNANNSRWYLRIAPDEVYFEPCAWKAGFHVSFARINPDSIAWQQKLEPIKGEMEKAMAKVAGPPYEARDVKFSLPDFIDIVVNAGDARAPHGATIGQSLPNWGAVAAKGGRTVAMTNLYTDADSRKTLEGQMASLFCPETMKGVTTDPKPAVMSTVLHEAAHNLGPSHEYKVDGKVDDEIFGGPLASTMEELKAQTAALFFAEWLAGKGVITREQADQAHLRDVAWGFGHVAQGMYTADGKPKNYSQLASIQLGSLIDAGALTWMPEQKAANGQDVGCFKAELAKFKSAIDALAATVFGIKSRGDKAAAEALKAKYVDADGEWKTLRGTIAERWLRAPKASFVYSVRTR